jgi:hypothetical protein
MSDEEWRRKTHIMEWIERVNFYLPIPSSCSYESIDNVMKELGFSRGKARLRKPYIREYIYCPHNITLKSRVLLSEQNPDTIGILYEGPLALVNKLRDRLEVKTFS